MTPTVSVMGIRFQATIYGNESVAAWQQFNKQITPALLAHKRYGIYESGETCSSDAFHMDTETAAFVGVEMPENHRALKGLLKKELRGGKYAKFTHKGTVATLIETYRYIWGVWFPKSGLELDNRDDFECYSERFTDVNDEKSEIDIYFPIR